MRQIETVEQFDKFMGEIAGPVDGQIEGVSVHERAALLDATKIQRLNKWAAANMKAAVVWLDLELAKHISGAEVVDGKVEQYHFAIGKGTDRVYYRLTKNVGNRPFTAAKVGDGHKEGYLHDWANGLWTMGDPGIIEAGGNIASLQHRAIACMMSHAINPDTPTVPVALLVGLPPQFGDNLDKGKVRTPSDREYRDVGQFPQSLVSEVFNFAEGFEPEPKDMEKLRKTLSSDIVTVCNYVHCRLRGVDVHATKKQLPSERQRLQFKAAFDTDNGNALERLLLQVTAASKDEAGKPKEWTKAFTVPMVVCGIILASNRMDTDEPINPDVREEVEGLRIDDTIVEETLSALSKSPSEGEAYFAPAIKEIAKAKRDAKAKTGGSVSTKRLMSAFVFAHLQILDDGAISQKVWENVSQAKGAKAQKTYRHYGGVDVPGSANESDDSDE